jgi:predicted metalloprotease
MINVPRKNLRRPALVRALVAVVALASCAALAMPGAEAAQPARSGATATQPIPVPETSAKVATGEMNTTAVAAWNSSTAWKQVRYNPLYSTPYLGASRCSEPKIALNTQANILKYDQYLLNCLFAVWKTPVSRARGSYTIKPSLVVHSLTQVKTACGTVNYPTSFYCSYKNGTIYIPWKYIAGFWKQNQAFARAYATQTLAHEYGHHVQRQTGILDASWWRQQHMTTSAAQLAESRRRELQAQCLGGVYLGADRAYYPMTGAILTQWKYLVSHSGDMKGYPRDHGTWTNNSFWSNAGFNGDGKGRHAASCQTFAASSTRIA